MNAPDNSPDGGPAFPIPLDDRPGSYPPHPGMSQRALFAVILMHSEAVTCGVPGEACDALVEASRAAGTEVIDHMAMNAVQGADALLRALAEPKAEPVPQHLTYDAWTTPDVEHRAIQSLSLHPRFADLPAFIRDFVKVAMGEIEKSESDIPF